MTILDLSALFPEMLMLVSALGLLIMGAFLPDSKTSVLCNFAVLFLMTTALMIVGQLNQAPNGLSSFSNSFVLDGFSGTFKVIILVATSICLLMAKDWFAKLKTERNEFPVLVMLAVTGMMALLSARDFLVFYIGLEMQSLALYVLATFHRDQRKSCEAGVKYFVLGALASGLLLYGISLVYGTTGVIRFDEIHTYALEHPHSIALLIGLGFILAGILFKLAAAPFHMWAPDVYEGAPSPVTSFFAIGPKMAAAGVLIQILFEPFIGMITEWQTILVFISALTMAVGALAGIGQTSLKRLLAYSSVSHVGFVLLGISTGTHMGLTAALAYLVFYVAMSLGAFAVLLAMKKQGKPVEDVADLAGIAHLHPGLAAGMAIIMFSMAGIPPMVGFFTKFYIFLAAIQADMVWLAVWGSIASVIGAYYYILVIKVMYADKPIASLDQPFAPTLSITVVVSSALSLVGLALLGPVLTLTQYALSNFPILP